MKKAGILFVVLSLCLGTATLWAASSEPVGETRSEALATEAQGSTCKALTSEEILTRFESSVTTSGLPSCPETSSSCSGGTVSTQCRQGDICRAATTTTVVDTGEHSCDSGGGQILTCGPSRTIHIKTIPCSQCPCCTATPFPCFCPNDCGAIQSWGCE